MCLQFLSVWWPIHPLYVFKVFWKKWSNQKAMKMKEFLIPKMFFMAEG